MSSLYEPLSLTLWVAFWSAILAVPLAFLAAWLVRKAPPVARRLLNALLLLPLALPPTAVGYIWLVTLSDDGPLGVNTLGVDPGILFSPAAAVLASTSVAFPLAFRTLVATFDGLDSELLKVAQTLGYRRWGVVFRFLLPLCQRGLAAAGIVSFMRAFGEFGATMMIAGNTPGVTQTLPAAIYSAHQAGADDGVRALVAVSLAAGFAALLLSETLLESRLSPRTGFWNRGKSGPPPPLPSALIGASPQPPVLLGSVKPWLELAVKCSLEGFTLDIKTEVRGGCFGIFGPSGSGKSTLLRAIAGLADASSHVMAHVASKDDRTAASALGRIGYAPQSACLFPHLTVLGNLRSGKFSSEALVTEVSDHFGVTPLHDKDPASLSGGERHLVSLARALCAAPNLLLLDEPFGGLDRRAGRALTVRLSSWLRVKSIACIFVSHDPWEIQTLCDELCVIESGRLRAQGATSTVLHEASLSGSASAGYSNALPCRILTQTQQTTTAALVQHHHSRNSSASPLVLSAPGARVARPPGQTGFAEISARDLILATSSVTGISAKNVLEGVFIGLSLGGQHREFARVELAGELPQILIELSSGSTDRLKLVPQQKCWVIAKESACRIYV